MPATVIEEIAGCITSNPVFTAFWAKKTRNFEGRDGYGAVSNRHAPKVRASRFFRKDRMLRRTERGDYGIQIFSEARVGGPVSHRIEAARSHFRTWSPWQHSFCTETGG